MKKILFFCFSTMLYFGCEPSQTTYDSYGEQMTSDNAISTEEFLSAVSEVEATYKLSGTIEEVCQMKGCWLTLKNEEGLNVRVTFKDYGFFVPKDISGSEVILEGVAFKEVLDEELARHYAEDGKKEYKESMRHSISFIASGVLVAKS